MGIIRALREEDASPGHRASKLQGPRLNDSKSPHHNQLHKVANETTQASTPSRLWLDTESDLGQVTFLPISGFGGAAVIRSLVK